VFAPNDFNSTKPPRPPLQNDRRVGLVVLIALIILCLIMVAGMDQTVFIPFNATYAPTLTWQSQHPTTPSTPGRRPTGRTPNRTITPNPALDQPISFPGNPNNP
jgi:hypothetical protein